MTELKKICKGLRRKESKYIRREMLKEEFDPYAIGEDIFDDNLSSFLHQFGCEYEDLGTDMRIFRILE